MGRKQKLRRERRKNNNANKTGLSTETRVATTAVTAAASSSSTVPAAAAKIPDPSPGERMDSVFPVSKFHPSIETICANSKNVKLYVPYLLRGATEHGCVKSFLSLGCLPTSQHFQISTMAWWFFLEGAIRGSAQCATSLIDIVYKNSKPYPPAALILYWIKMVNKYIEWSKDRIDDGNLITVKECCGCTTKECRDMLVQKCVVCGKIDTDTLTMKQCRGCSMCCYCGPECQEVHWSVYNHRNECKQIRILNKYHKSFAKEIRAAVIRGEAYIPAVEKLRYKLGLTRPIKDYQELRDGFIHDKKAIDPSFNFVARDDGTVWIGTFPFEIGSPPVAEHADANDDVDDNADANTDDDVNADIDADADHTSTDAYVILGGKRFTISSKTSKDENIGDGDKDTVAKAVATKLVAKDDVSKND